MRRTTLLSLLAGPILALAACSGDGPQTIDDGGILADSGQVTPDTGAAEDDAGTIGDDAGTTDAGPALDDAGVPDSGTGDAGQADAGGSDAGVTPGEPIVAPDDTWTWVPFPGSHCMNDTPTGIGVNLQPGATKVLIYMEGGNACFNQVSCATTANTNGYGESNFRSTANGLPNRPIFNRGAENIFNDYSYVYVPYCTGDVHAGTNMNGSVGNAAYTFMGFDNVRQYLERLVPTFSAATEVVLSGSSAGGFGAMLNFDQVQRAFGPSVRVTLVDDSGPPMSGDFIEPCLQAHFRSTWGFDDGVLAGCAGCLATPDGTFIEPYFDYLLNLYADRTFAVISSDGDSTIRTFWGFGVNDCARLDSFTPGTFSAAMYRAGLEGFRDEMADGYTNVGLFMKTNSTRHVWLTPDPLANVSQDGVNLSDWLLGATQGTITHVPGQ
ncbi:MAG: hypothetical protein H6730_21155 [Deltaproteobacteria bacterium]|nr:hypothetical protein [Deltaproteobacteria bacterium]